MSVYGAHVGEYLAAGLPVFPVDTQSKTPAVRNWQKTTAKSARALADRFADADGLGVVMGARSRITEVDVDIAGDAALAFAMERFGDSPGTIRTASGKSKIWYRHAGESRRVRPVPDIDVLGGGFTIAPPSWRNDLGAAYRFLTGGLDDLDSLPTIRAGALDSAPHSAVKPPEAVRNGERNTWLFYRALEKARHCDDVER